MDEFRLFYLFGLRTRLDKSYLMIDYIYNALSDSIYKIWIVIFSLLIDPFLSFELISPFVFRLFWMDMIFASYINDGMIDVSFFLYLYIYILANSSFLLFIKTLIYCIIKRIWVMKFYGAYSGFLSLIFWTAPRYLWFIIWSRQSG